MEYDLPFQLPLPPAKDYSPPEIKEPENRLTEHFVATNDKQRSFLRRKGVTAVGLKKDGENYIVSFDDTSTCEAYNTPLLWAQNPELSFDAQDYPAFAHLIQEARTRTRNICPEALPADINELPSEESPSPEVKAPKEMINVLGTLKEIDGKTVERYVFVFGDAFRAAILRILGEYAYDPELSFTWNDVVLLAQKIRNEIGQSFSEGELATFPQEIRDFLLDESAWQS
jgi:hypothetical protein